MTFCSVILMSDGRLKRITAVGGKPRRYFYHLLFAHYPSREVFKTDQVCHPEIDAQSFLHKLWAEGCGMEGIFGLLDTPCFGLQR
jgi:hypothetical protein